MTRAGWSCKRLAAALDYKHAASATNGVQKAYQKLAMLSILDFPSTWADLRDAAERTPLYEINDARQRLLLLDGQLTPARSIQPEMPEMTPTELENRVRALTGREPLLTNAR